MKNSTQDRSALKILFDRPKARSEVHLHKMCVMHPNTIQIIFANTVVSSCVSPRVGVLVVME